MCVLCSLPPTSLLPGAAYHDLGKAFLGEGLLVSTPPQLRRALTHAFSRERTTKRRGKPLVINVIIDPYSSRKPQVREQIEEKTLKFFLGSLVADKIKTLNLDEDAYQ